MMFHLLQGLVFLAGLMTQLLFFNSTIISEVSGYITAPHQVLVGQEMETFRRLDASETLKNLTSGALGLQESGGSYLIANVVEVVLSLGLGYFIAGSLGKFERKDNIPEIPGDEGRFDTGLWDCFGDCHSCLIASLCPLVLWAQTEHKAGIRRFWPSLLLLCAVFVFSLVFNGFVMFGLLFYFRMRLRVMGNLERRPCADCCVAFWCQCCALVQQARHVNRAVEVVGSATSVRLVAE